MNRKTPERRQPWPNQSTLSVNNLEGLRRTIVLSEGSRCNHHNDVVMFHSVSHCSVSVAPVVARCDVKFRGVNCWNHEAPARRQQLFNCYNWTEFSCCTLKGRKQSTGCPASDKGLELSSAEQMEASWFRVQVLVETVGAFVEIRTWDFMFSK
jgi:hypothetical protein